MNYPETTDFLFSRLPLFSRIGAAAYKADLLNITALCDALGNPQQSFRSIHIAGTNGKGSTSHLLAAILQTAGYKTGLYTSPHLKDFRERIKVDGTLISEDFVVRFTEQLLPLIEKLSPSFFEITVAMAFAYFKEQQVEVAVIETGLGGRLDSTNIITPVLSVITNIGWDHMNLLGDTLEKIAGEKAGIIKQGIPVVIGEVLPVTQPVFEQKASELQAPLTIAATARQVMDWHWEKNELVVEVATPHHTDHRTYHLDLPGLYQTHNLLTVLEACHQLQQQGWRITEAAITHGLQHSKKINGLHGRWELIHQRPPVVLDVAHNANGIQQLLQQLELMNYHHLHIITGMVKDKEVEKMISLLPTDATYYFTRAQIPRALPEKELQEKAEAAGLKGSTYAEVNAALKAAMAKAHENDLVLICGSVFLVGEVNWPVN